MKALFAFVLAIVLTAVQAALLCHVGGGLVSLAMTLPIVVYLGLNAGNVDGAVGSAAVGYVIDVMAGGPKGLMTFLAVALFLGVRLVGAGLDVGGKGAFAVLSGLGTALYGLLTLAIMRLVTPSESAPGWSLLGRVVVEGIATGVLSPIVLGIMSAGDRLFTREEPGLL